MPGLVNEINGCWLSGGGSRHAGGTCGRAERQPKRWVLRLEPDGSVLRQSGGQAAPPKEIQQQRADLEIFGGSTEKACKSDKVPAARRIFKHSGLDFALPILASTLGNKTATRKSCNVFRYLIKLHDVTILLDFPGLISVNQAVYGAFL